MPRIARVVFAGVPHHITQRGNRRADVFWTDDDRQAYVRLLGRQAARYGLGVLGYCLMTTHVHLVAVPREAASLAKASPKSALSGQKPRCPRISGAGRACGRKAEPYHGLGLELRLGFPRYTLMFSRHVDIFGKSRSKTMKKGSSSSEKMEKVAKKKKKTFP